MNKSLLLVICDFLLISLLGLANFDDPAEAEEEQPVLASKTEPGDARDDLILMLEESLEEQASREKALQSTIEEKSDLLAEKEDTLIQTNTRLNELSETLEEANNRLSETEAQKKAVEEERIALAQEQERLLLEKEELAQVAATLETKTDELESNLSQLQEETANLQKAFAVEKEEKVLSLEQAQFLREELKREKEALSKLSEELATKDKEQRAIEQEREAAERKLEVAAAQNTILEEQLKTQQIQQEILQERTEQLSENVEQLTQKSTSLEETVARDIAENRTISANQLYDRYQRNKVELIFVAREKGALGLGERVNTYRLDGPILAQGGAYYSLIHRDALPLGSLNGRIPLEMRGAIQVDQNKFPITQVIPSQKDSSLLWIPLNRDFIERNALQAFDLEADALRFEEAYIVREENGYYGTLSLRIHPEKPSFIQVDSRIVTRIFGEFSASTGDYIFSNKGTFIGMMTNPSDGLLTNQLSFGKGFLIGNNFDPVQARAALNL